AASAAPAAPAASTSAADPAASTSPIGVVEVPDGRHTNTDEYEVRFIALSGDVVESRTGPLPVRYRPLGTEGFVRVEVRMPSTGARAWSQPFWLQPDREAISEAVQDPFVQDPFVRDSIVQDPLIELVF